MDESFLQFLPIHFVKFFFIHTYVTNIIKPLKYWKTFRILPLIIKVGEKLPTTNEGRYFNCSEGVALRSHSKVTYQACAAMNFFSATFGMPILTCQDNCYSWELPWLATESLLGIWRHSNVLSRIYTWHWISCRHLSVGVQTLTQLTCL